MQARPARNSAGWYKGTGRRDSCEQGQLQLQVNQLGFLMQVLQGAKMNPSSRKLTTSAAARRRDTSTCQFLQVFSHVCPAHCSSLCSQAGPGCPRPDSDSAAPTASQPLCCLYCFMAFCSLGPCRANVTSQHSTPKIAPSWVSSSPPRDKLEWHLRTEHTKVTFSQATTAQIVHIRTALCHIVHPSFSPMLLFFPNPLCGPCYPFCSMISHSWRGL